MVSEDSPKDFDSFPLSELSLDSSCSSKPDFVTWVPIIQNLIKRLM
jgi:hypothetical protein